MSASLSTGHRRGAMVRSRRRADEGYARCHVCPPSSVASRNPPAALPAIQPCCASGNAMSFSDAPVKPSRGRWLTVRPPSVVRVDDQVP
jgi:hypothetical protein